MMCLNLFPVFLKNHAKNNIAKNIDLHLILYLPGWLFGPDFVTEKLLVFLCIYSSDVLGGIKVPV